MAIIEIKVQGSVLQTEAIKRHLQKLANNCDVDTLQKVADLSDNKKAIDTLKNPPAMLKMALGIK